MDYPVKKKIQGTVQSVKFLSSGTSQSSGKQWKKFEVIINGEKFHTFDFKFQDLVNTAGEFEYEEKTIQSRNGSILSRTLSRIGGNSNFQKGQARPQENGFKVLNEKLDKIIALLSKSKAQEELDSFSFPDEIKSEKIPF